MIRYSLALISFTVALSLAMLCYFSAGISLDFFIGSVFFAAILTPPLSAIAGRLPGALATVASITLGFAGCWCVAIHTRAITIAQWLMCVLLLLSFLTLLMSAVRLLMKARVSPTAASAVVTIAALLWLAWPVWLAGSIVGAQLHYSTEFHPLFAMNQTLSSLGIWTEQQVAYNLTNLGQDVQYELPPTAWPAIIAQSAVAILLTAVNLIWRKS